MAHPQKFIWLLAALVIGLGLVVWQQGRKTANITVRTTPRPLIANIPVDIPIAPSDPLLGNPGAPLTLVAFFDLGDKTSRALLSTVYAFVKANPKAARLVWKDLPRPHIFGSDATPAHLGARCAGEQKKFWEFVMASSTLAGEIAESHLIKTAAAIKLNTLEWQRCREAGAVSGVFAPTQALAESLGFKSAPALFVNNKQVDITQEFDLRAMLESFVTP